MILVGPSSDPSHLLDGVRLAPDAAFGSRPARDQRNSTVKSDYQGRRDAREHCRRRRPPSLSYGGISIGVGV
jgi:hypothetical protein